MPRAKLRVTLPEGTWIRTISDEYPEASFRVLAALSGDETGVGLVEVSGPDLSAVLTAMDEADGVLSLDLLRVVDDEALVQFETTDPLLVLSARESKVPFEPPVLIQGGEATMEVTAPRDRLSELGDRLEAFGMPFDVVYVRSSIESTDLLTEPQRALLVTAVERGYYDTPRECTLTELAESVGIAKSTASERLHRAEEKVVKQFVEETTRELPKNPPSA